MAKLKLLKMPKVPKLGKKPAASASLSTKQAWLRRMADTKAKYEAKCKAIQKENASRVKENKLSEKLSQVISGVTNVASARPSSFRTSIRRKKRTTAVSGHKKKGRKAAPKKAAKKRTTRRR